MKIAGNIIDIRQRSIYYAMLTIEDGKISAIEKKEGESKNYLLPGFVDAHVHIESSMLVPSEFARLATVHGTVATVSDPHEIANVLGIAGVKYMIGNGNKVPFKFNFGAPSCVPATSFETAGAVIDVAGVKELLKMPEIKYLAEMMNYPGVLFNDEEVWGKLKIAKELGKPIDGHAPGLRGEDAKKYIDAGITTDHECFTYEEALEKLNHGMKILIREGSAAKNFEALIDLLPEHYEQMMFCSDDKHPDDLILGHINKLVARALKKGCQLFDVLQVACINPVEHYGLDLGTLRVGDSADFILTNDLINFEIKTTYINGELVAKGGTSLIERVPVTIVNHFDTTLKTPSDFQVTAEGADVQVIKAINGEIVTESFTAPATIVDGKAVSNISNDILKMCVVNRYREAPISFAFINGFEIQSGALASCVGHDSHNIIAIGVDDESLCRAVNLIIENKGGVSAINGGQEKILTLPVAGIMSDQDGYRVAADYSDIDKMVKEDLGSKLTAPFMTLSFMALLVIPQLKLSDKGLFDGQGFNFSPLFPSSKS